MELAELFQRLGTALGLGLLVGLQRERAGSRLAGFRTFPLVTVLGALCALLGDQFGGWIVGIGLAALAIVIAVGNLPMLKTEEEHQGGDWKLLGRIAVSFCIAVGVGLLLLGVW